MIFALQNAPLGRQRLKGLEIAPLVGEELRVRFDLEVHAFERGGQLELFWIYNRDLFERWRIEQMARHYVRLLEAVVAAPEVPVARLELLGARGAAHPARGALTRRRGGCPRRPCPALFEAQVARTPEALALVCGEERLSYGELNARANRLAHLLIAWEWDRRRLVGIALERSPEMVVALLGTSRPGPPICPWTPTIRRPALRTCSPTPPPPWCSVAVLWAPASQARLRC